MLACFDSSFCELRDKLALDNQTPGLIAMAPEKRQLLEGHGEYDREGSKFRGVPVRFSNQLIPEQAEVHVLGDNGATLARYRLDMTGARHGAVRIVA